jgi:hypothetical protein
MPDSFDFEQAWRSKFARCIEAVAGEDVRSKVVHDKELTPTGGQQGVIEWTRQAMRRLDALVGENQQKIIMTGCACQYPKANLQAAREAHVATGDVDVPHQMLQAQFVTFLRDTLALDEQMVQESVHRGWGLAGIREGNTIIATKIPKSGHLIQYLEEPDPEKRRRVYCHCPRIRTILETSGTLSEIYCYCGAGFYKSIWEEILQDSVDVELLESVLQGDDVCRIAIHLPPDQVTPLAGCVEPDR